MITQHGDATKLLGVDPGGRHTGICLIDRDFGEVSGMVIDRDQGEPVEAYAARVVLSISGWLLHLDVCAIEAWTHPNPHLGIANLTGLLDTVFVAGYVASEAAAVTEVRMVPPAGHGKRPIDAYPRSLVGDREVEGTGRMRHARSAYDVARAALTLLRHKGAA